MLHVEAADLELIVAAARGLLPLSVVTGVKFAVYVTPLGVQIRILNATTDHVAAQDGAYDGSFVAIEGEPVTVIWRTP